MAELWLLRHGATTWAQEGRHTGRTDLPLLPEGEAEARRVAPLLQQLGGHPFAAVLVSPLQRARRTAELAGLGEQAQLCDDLLEWNYGAYEGITTATIRETVPGWTVWSHGCPEGEDSAAVQLRCERVIAPWLRPWQQAAPARGWPWWPTATSCAAWRAPGWGWGQAAGRCW